jgi:acyl-CoA thioester hydrolase
VRAEIPLPPHLSEVEVRFREVDAYGVAWHGHYADWLECARQRYAAAFGFDLAGELARGYTAPMVELSVKYRRPARFGDRLLVEVRTGDDPRLVFDFRYRIRRPADGELLATARTLQVLVGPRGLLVGWPEPARALRAALRAHEAALPPW